jgi:DNA-binding XRE family transcriptional regulator
MMARNNPGVASGSIENHLSHIREKRGYSAAALASKIGVSRQTI